MNAAGEWHKEEDGDEVCWRYESLAPSPDSVVYDRRALGYVMPHEGGGYKAVVLPSVHSGGVTSVGEYADTDEGKKAVEVWWDAHTAGAAL